MTPIVDSNPRRCDCKDYPKKALPACVSSRPIPIAQETCHLLIHRSCPPAQTHGDDMQTAMSITATRTSSHTSALAERSAAHSLRTRHDTLSPRSPTTRVVRSFAVESSGLLHFRIRQHMTGVSYAPLILFAQLGGTVRPAILATAEDGRLHCLKETELERGGHCRIKPEPPTTASDIVTPQASRRSSPSSARERCRGRDSGPAPSAPGNRLPWFRAALRHRCR